MCKMVGKLVNIVYRNLIQIETKQKRATQQHNKIETDLKAQHRWMGPPLRVRVIVTVTFNS